MNKVDIKEIYDKFTNGKAKISGTDIRLFVESPFAVFCRHFADEKLKDSRSEYFELLFKKGNIHEDNVVKELYPKAEQCDVKDRKQGFMELLEEMQKGVESLHNFPLMLLQEGLHGEFDILEKRKGKSDFGNYYYIVKEIKHAKNVREKHAMQAAFYNYLLGKIQGYTPEKFYIINREMKSFGFKYSDFKEKVENAIEGVNKILDERKASATYNACAYPWKTYCNKMAIENNDISLALNVGLKRKITLNKIGLCTLKDLANTDIDKLIGLDGVGNKTAQAMRRSAESLVKNKPIVFGKVTMPNAKTIIYLDLEGTDDEGLIKIDYLFGALVDGKYYSFVAHKREDEGKMFAEFLEFLKQYDQYLLYHFGDYEKTRIKHMIKLYGIGEEVLDKLVDLHKIIREYVAFPAYGQGLKEIAHYLGYNWKHKEVNAMESVALYNDYLETGDKHKLQLVIDYNEDDVRATEVIKVYLDKIDS